MTPTSAGPSAKPDPTDAGGSAGEMTMTGEVEAGVEHGCLVMQSGGKTYLLVGGDRSIVREGARVTVRGRPNPDLITTCQQGEPFEVAEAHPA
jgi:hypothetical protein